MSDQTDIKEVADTYALELRTDYSGRSMYGKECLGLVGGTVEITVALTAFGRGDLAKKAIWDNMGLSMIAYWPTIQNEEEESIPTEATKEAAREPKAD